MDARKLNTLNEHLQDLDDSVKELKKCYENYISFFRQYNLQEYPTAAIDSLWQQLENLNSTIVLETFKLQCYLPNNE